MTKFVSLILSAMGFIFLNALANAPLTVQSLPEFGTSVDEIWSLAQGVIPSDLPQSLSSSVNARLLQAVYVGLNTSPWPNHNLFIYLRPEESKAELSEANIWDKSDEPGLLAKDFLVTLNGMAFSSGACSHFTIGVEGKVFYSEREKKRSELQVKKISSTAEEFSRCL